MKSVHHYFIIFCVVFVSCNNVEQARVSSSHSVVDIEMLIRQSNNYYQQNEYEKAIPIFDKIVSVDSTRGEIYYRRGYCRAQLFDYEGSTNDYIKAVELNYRVEESYFSLGCNYAATYNDTLALKFFMKAYELNPNNENAKREVALFKKRLGIVDI